jgi:hypothetical protein
MLECAAWSNSDHGEPSGAVGTVALLDPGRGSDPKREHGGRFAEVHRAPSRDMSRRRHHVVRGRPPSVRCILTSPQLLHANTTQGAPAGSGGDARTPLGTRRMCGRHAGSAIRKRNLWASLLRTPSIAPRRGTRLPLKGARGRPQASVSQRIDRPDNTRPRRGPFGEGTGSVEAEKSHPATPPIAHQRSGAKHKGS